MKPVACASKRWWLKPHPTQNSLPCLNACQQMSFLGKKKRRRGNQETSCTEGEAEGRLLCIRMLLLKCSAATSAGHPDEHGSTSNANSLIWLLSLWAAACASLDCAFVSVKCVFLEAMMSEQIANPIHKILSKGKSMSEVGDWFQEWIPLTIKCAPSPALFTAFLSSVVLRCFYLSSFTSEALLSSHWPPTA